MHKSITRGDRFPMIDMHIYLTGEDSTSIKGLALNEDEIPRQDKTRLSDSLSYHDSNRNWYRI